ncbi:MAG: hypothetical protein ABI042_17705 [Verrucomicrobiota bacterium]
MNTSPTATNSETRQKTYIRAVLFLLPALCFWASARVFLLPKLEYDWQRSTVAVSEAHWVMNVVHAVMHHGGVVLLALTATFLLLELRFAIYRRIAVGATVFALNSAVMLGLTAMCMAALIK